MAKYDGVSSSALALISRKGAVALIERKNVGTVDTTLGVVTGASVQSASLPMVGLPPGRSAEARIGSLVDRKLMEFHIARKGNAWEPAHGDEILWGGQRWKLFWVTHYDPAADGAIYTLAYGEG